MAGCGGCQALRRELVAAVVARRVDRVALVVVKAVKQAVRINVAARKPAVELLRGFTVFTHSVRARGTLRFSAVLTCGKSVGGDASPPGWVTLWRLHLGGAISVS